MASDYTWPRPYLLGLYERAVLEGCIRILLRGPDYAAEWRSFKAAFLRLRRKKDGDYSITMQPEYRHVQLRFEPEHNKVLIIYNALPDGETLPAIESVDGKYDIPRPQSKPTPESNPEEDFNAQDHVSKLISGLDIAEDEDEEGDVSEL